METQLRKNEKELDTFKQKYNEIIEKINLKRDDYREAKVTGNVKQQEKIDVDLVSLDNEASSINQKIKSITNESVRLKDELSKLRIDPTTSIEAQNLKVKIDLANESLKDSKNEANEMAQNLKKVGKIKLTPLVQNIKDVGSSIKNILIGKKGISGGITNVSKNIDKFKSRVTKMISTIAIFRLLRSSITSLSNGLLGMLNSNKTFANNLNQIKVNLMTAFAPIYNYVLPAINTLMNVLSRMTGSIAVFMASVFGQTATQAKKNAKELYNQAKAQQAVADAQEGSISSFDKLEVNSEEDKSSNGNSSSNLDFSKDIQTSSYLDKLLDDLKTKIGDGLWFDAGATIANELNSVIEKIDIKGFFEKGKEVATNICKGINGFISTFNWGELGSKVSDAFRGIGSMILTILKETDWQAVGNAIGDFLLAIDWAGIASDLINIFFEGLCGLGDLLIGLIDSIIEVFNDPEFPEKFAEAGVNILLGIVNGIESVFSKINEVFMKIIELFLSLFGIHSPSTVFTEFGKYIMQGLINGISGLINNVTQLFSNLLSTIQKVFSTAWTSLKSGASNAWNGIKNVFSAGGKVFDGIKDGIVNAFKNIVNALIKGINKVIKTPFDGINNALKKIKNIEILGAKPFKGLINTVSVPQIPMLAKGAVIPPNAKFAAILGDQRNGKNLEAPESLIRKIVREESGQEKEIILNATIIAQFETGEEFGRASLKGIRLCEDADGQAYLL